MVATDKGVDDIVSEVINFADKEAIIKHLSSYQRSRPDWDNYRNKMPEQLLDKFKKVLQRCREYGFIAPRVQGEQLVWKRIMSCKRNYKNADQCTLCSSSQRAGDCKGHAVYVGQQRMFKTCWR